MDIQIKDLNFLEESTNGEKHYVILRQLISNGILRVDNPGNNLSLVLDKIKESIKDDDQFVFGDGKDKKKKKFLKIFEEYFKEVFEENKLFENKTDFIDKILSENGIKDQRRKLKKKSQQPTKKVTPGNLSLKNEERNLIVRYSHLLKSLIFESYSVIDGDITEEKLINELNTSIDNLNDTIEDKNTLKDENEEDTNTLETQEINMLKDILKRFVNNLFNKDSTEFIKSVRKFLGNHLRPQQLDSFYIEDQGNSSIFENQSKPEPSSILNEPTPRSRSPSPNPITSYQGRGKGSSTPSSEESDKGKGSRSTSGQGRGSSPSRQGRGRSRTRQGSKSRSTSGQGRGRSRTRQGSRSRSTSGQGRDRSRTRQGSRSRSRSRTRQGKSTENERKTKVKTREELIKEEVLIPTKRLPNKRKVVVRNGVTIKNILGGNVKNILKPVEYTNVKENEAYIKMIKNEIRLNSKMDENEKINEMRKQLSKMGIDKSDSLARYIYIYNDSSMINSVMANLKAKGPVLKEIVFQLSYLGIQEYEIIKIINYFVLAYNQDKLVDIALILNSNFKLEGALSEILSGIEENLSKETKSILFERVEYRNNQMKNRKPKVFKTNQRKEDVINMDFSRNFVGGSRTRTRITGSDKQAIFKFATTGGFFEQTKENYNILGDILDLLFKEQGPTFGNKTKNYYKIYYVILYLINTLKNNFYIFDKTINEYQIAKMLIKIGQLKGRNELTNLKNNLKDSKKFKPFENFESFVNIVSKNLFTNRENKNLVHRKLFERKNYINNKKNLTDQSIKDGSFPLFIGTKEEIGINRELTIGGRNSSDLVEFRFVSLAEIDFFDYYSFSFVQEIKSDVYRGYDLTQENIINLISKMLQKNVDKYKADIKKKSIICEFIKNVFGSYNHKKYKKLYNQTKCKKTIYRELEEQNNNRVINNDTMIESFGNLSEIANDAYTPRENVVDIPFGENSPRSTRTNRGNTSAAAEVTARFGLSLTRWFTRY